MIGYPSFSMPMYMSLEQARFSSISRLMQGSADSNREASGSDSQAPASASGEAHAEDSSTQSTATPSRFAALGLDREVSVFSRAALEAAAPSERCH